MSVDSAREGAKSSAGLFLVLFADTEVLEYVLEDILGGDLTGDGAKGLGHLTEVHRQYLAARA